MTESLTFLHTADLHLGAPFRGLAKVSPAWAARLVQAIAEAFDRVIDTAVSRKVDFVVISGDVFEHTPIRDLAPALHNCRRLLSDDGVMLFTVPYFKMERTQEHFPNLDDFRIVEEEGKRVLLNTTIDGQQERFEDLVFHGGEGSTLEMRLFAETDLLALLQQAGFSSTRIYTDIVPEHGILWPMDWAVPIAARA